MDFTKLSLIQDMNIIRKFWFYYSISWNQITTYLEKINKYLLKYFWKIINIHIQNPYTITNNFDNNDEGQEEGRDNYV